MRNEKSYKKFPKKIKNFILYSDPRQDVKGGAIYFLNIKIPFSPCKKRMLRVYLPDNYDFKKTYSVIYMSDGQNSIDKKLSSFGSWDLDTIDNILIKRKLEPFIIVGIDCPNDEITRVREYTYLDLPFKNKLGEICLNKYNQNKMKPYGEKMAEFIVKKIKPLIDNTFLTKPGKQFTYFAGSSMGGLFSFEIVRHYSDVFSKCISFSPAFFLYKDDALFKDVKKNMDFVFDNKYYFYSGGKNKYEAQFIKPMLKMSHLLQNIGYPKQCVEYKIDKRYIHNEKAWHAHFLEAIYFLGGYKNESK